MKYYLIILFSIISIICFSQNREKLLLNDLLKKDIKSIGLDGPDKIIFLNESNGYDDKLVINDFKNLLKISEYKLDNFKFSQSKNDNHEIKKWISIDKTESFKTIYQIKSTFKIVCKNENIDECLIFYTFIIKTNDKIIEYQTIENGGIQFYKIDNKNISTMHVSIRLAQTCSKINMKAEIESIVDRLKL